MILTLPQAYRMTLCRRRKTSPATPMRLPLLSGLLPPPFPIVTILRLPLLQSVAFMSTLGRVGLVRQCLGRSGKRRLGEILALTDLSGPGTLPPLLHPVLDTRLIPHQGLQCWKQLERTPVVTPLMAVISRPPLPTWIFLPIFPHRLDLRTLPPERP